MARPKVELEESGFKSSPNRRTLSLRAAARRGRRGRRRRAAQGRLRQARERARRRALPLRAEGGLQPARHLCDALFHHHDLCRRHARQRLRLQGLHADHGGRNLRPDHDARRRGPDGHAPVQGALRRLPGGLLPGRPAAEGLFQQAHGHRRGQGDAARAHRGQLPAAVRRDLVLPVELRRHRARAQGQHPRRRRQDRRRARPELFRRRDPRGPGDGRAAPDAADLPGLRPGRDGAADQPLQPAEKPRGRGAGAAPRRLEQADLPLQAPARPQDGRRPAGRPDVHRLQQPPVHGAPGRLRPRGLGDLGGVHPDGLRALVRLLLLAPPGLGAAARGGRRDRGRARGQRQQEPRELRRGVRAPRRRHPRRGRGPRRRAAALAGAWGLC